MGDVLEKFKDIPDESIDCIITSPPYWGLRNYGIEGQMGLEKNFNEYLDKLDLIMDECHRVLKPTGTCWVNLGDTYSTISGGMKDINEGKTKQTGKINYTDNGKESVYSVDQSKLYSNLKHKSRVGIPERFYIRCIDKGWVARNHIPWIKANSMPSSVRDRFTNKWESIFFFAKKPKGYYFNLDAVRVEPKTGYGLVKSKSKGKRKSLEVLKQQENMSNFGFANKHNYGLHQRRENGEAVTNCHPLGKNPGDVFRDKAVYDKSKPYAVVEREGVIYYRNLPPLNELIDYLNEARKKIGMSINVLEDVFGNYTPHHWFDRGYGSYPTKEDWIKTKEILKFDDKYDGVMTTEYIKDAEKTNNPKGKNPGDVFRDSNAKTKDITSPSGSAERTLIDLNTNVERNKESRIRSVLYGKNPGDVFEINTRPCKEAHFATFPPTLPEKILKCSCPKGGTVLDPFFGAGTVGLVAEQLDLNWIGIEINPEYVEIAKKRIGNQQKLTKHL